MNSICLLLVTLFICLSSAVKLPLIINTWGFSGATNAAYKSISCKTPVKSVVDGCSWCERNQCDTTVGYGGSPDENGQTTLDAMIMDGKTHDVGSVGALEDIKDAIAVAEAVMLYTKHTLLVGKLATEFAVKLGFKKESLQTAWSKDVWMKWKHHNCQPNYWQNVSPDPKKNCGPYSSPYAGGDVLHSQGPSVTDTSPRFNAYITADNHDTIGMLAIDSYGNIAAGTSTNGASHKVAGRVGDSPIIGAGAYADNEIGGAAATGDGDVMMRFLPSYLAVEMMGRGYSPTNATRVALNRIVKYYPEFQGALISASINGYYGASCHGLGTFPYSVRNPEMTQTNVIRVKCT